MSELSDGVQEIETWVVQGKAKLDKLVVDYGVEESVQQALETYKVSSFRPNTNFQSLLGDLGYPCVLPPQFTADGSGIQTRPRSRKEEHVECNVSSSCDVKTLKLEYTSVYDLKHPQRVLKTGDLQWPHSDTL